MKKISFNLFFLVILAFVGNKSFATDPYTGVICVNPAKTIKMEFIFVNKDEYLTDVLKRIEGQFIKVGEVVGSKPGSFTLWEDKNAYKGIDFAWHLDKVTATLKPLILSESLKKMNKLPEPLSCRSESFWY